jgi:hypothetical protein
MTLEEMTAQRDALLAARYRGLRTVEIDGRRVTVNRRGVPTPIGASKVLNFRPEGVKLGHLIT